MHRFYVPETSFVPQQNVELPAEVLRHLRTVLRLSEGAECELLDGKGAVARVVLQSDYRAQVLSVSNCSMPVCHLTLIQGLPKGEKLELILQKGTELGVNRFIPVPMKRSIGRLKAEREQKRLQRWEKIIQEAARQCGQPYLPELQVGTCLESAIAGVDADLKLLLWEASGRPIDQLLPQQQPESIAVIVGPEGGITAEEVTNAELAGYQPVSLGPRILRTETAGLAIMTILQYLYGDLVIDRSRDTASQGKDES